MVKDERMKASILSAFVMVPLVAASAACSSSSKGTGPTDAAQDTSRPSRDAKADVEHTSDGGGRKDAEAGHDASKTGDAGTDAGDAGADAKGCPGIDAAISGFSIGQACKACIANQCCSEATTCAAASGCPAIEECATKCVAAGNDPKMCATSCIEMDAGVPDALSPTQMTAEALDLCISFNCSADCS